MELQNNGIITALNEPPALEAFETYYGTVLSCTFIGSRILLDNGVLVFTFHYEAPGTRVLCSLKRTLTTKAGHLPCVVVETVFPRTPQVIYSD